MKIYNSLTDKLEVFKPINEGQIKMYVCGPTIYSDIHIGNARPLIFFDVVARYFKKQGLDVKYVSNITDIDDKIIKKAQELNITEEELVAINYKEYIKVCKDLRIDDFYQQPRVTDFIPEIVEFIQKLIDHDYAYLSGDDVYFDTSKASDYGELSNINLDQNKEGTRIQANDKKRNPADFTLWKKTSVGITFDAPFGVGRPGWHTECVVMINAILGNNIDIHGGGIDLKFPHHENENAQNKCLNGSLANYWVHNGFIELDNEKMSKSLGNTILVKDILAKLNANQVRLLMLQTNYRQPININDNFLKQTNTIDEKLHKLFQLTKGHDKQDDAKNSHIDELNGAMSHDFSTANVITKLIAMLKLDVDQAMIQAIYYGLEMLGLEYSYEQELEIPAEVLALIEQRNQKKEEKLYAEADKIKQDILMLGYEILDTRDGVKCKIAQKK